SSPTPLGYPIVNPYEGSSCANADGEPITSRPPIIRTVPNARITPPPEVQSIVDENIALSVENAADSSHRFRASARWTCPGVLPPMVMVESGSRKVVGATASTALGVAPLDKNWSG